MFADDWGDDAHEGWTIIRDVEPFFFGQTAVFTDFLLRHSSGREFHLEIVGFWQESYLVQKRRKMELLHDIPLIIATPYQLDWDLGNAIMVEYKKQLPAQAILDALPSIP